MNLFQRLSAALAVVALLAIGGTLVVAENTPAAQQNEVVVKDLTDATAAAEIDNSKIPVIIDFYATWCGPCKLLAPNIDALAADKAYKGKVKVLRCDVDQNPALVAKYGINRYPTIITVKPGTKPTVSTHIGYKTLSQLKAMADALLK